MVRLRLPALRTVPLLAVLLSAACGGPTVPPPASNSISGGPAVSAGPGLPQQNSEVKRLIAAAKAAGENELDLAWGESTIGGGVTAKKMGTLLQQAYGLSVNVQFTPAPSMTTMAGRIAQEAAAGQKAVTDVFLGSEGHFASFLQTGGMEEYDYTQLGPRVAKDTVVTRNIGIEIVTRFPGVSYNSTVIPDSQAPQKLADLLDPKYKGKIAGEANAASFDRVAFRPEWTPDTMKDFVTKFSPLVSGLIRCEELERLTTGEFGMFALDCGGFEAHRWRDRGAPINHAIPEDAALAVFFFTGVPKTAAHPNLAKLYIDVMMSEAGQKLLYDDSYGDLHTLPGSRTAPELKDIEARGIKPLAITPQFLIDHPEDVQLRDDFQKIIAQKH